MRFQDDFRENLVDQQEQQQKQIQVQERRPRPEEPLEIDMPVSCGIHFLM